MAFKLGDHIATLDYDFGNGISGTVPEPSRKATVRFTSRTADALLASGRKIEDRTDLDEVSKVMADMTEAEMEAISDETFAATVELCCGHPSAEELDSIGQRGFQAFVGWLSGELRNPESEAPDTTVSQADQRGA